MSEDLTRRYAVSYYCDLRLGLLGGKEHSAVDAYTATARKFGSEAAAYARETAR